jgi:hypothetical protein
MAPMSNLAVISGDHRRSPPPLPADPTFRRIVQDLDMTRLTDRILVMGSVWKQRTEKGSRRNNLNDVGRFLNTRYPRQRYTVWNFSSMSIYLSSFYHKPGELDVGRLFS